MTSYLTFENKGARHGRKIKDENKSKCLYGYHLFCWNWKFITESTVDKDKN